MRELLKVMKALSDPNRVKIIKMLQRRVLCVCEIQAALGLAQSTASKHLKILEDAGLITFEKDRQWINYRLDDGSRSIYAATMLENACNWLEDDTEIATLLARLPDIDRTTIRDIREAHPTEPADTNHPQTTMRPDG